MRSYDRFAPPPLMKRAHLKLIESAAEIMEEPARVGDKTFAPRLLAITTFPHQQPKGNPEAWTRWLPPPVRTSQQPPLPPFRPVPPGQGHRSHLRPPQASHPPRNRPCTPQRRPACASAASKAG